MFFGGGGEGGGVGGRWGVEVVGGRGQWNIFLFFFQFFEKNIIGKW